MGLCNFTDQINIQHVAGEIGCMRADDRPGVRPDQPLEVFITDTTLLIRLHEIKFHASFPLQPVQRPENGVVFQNR